MNEVTKIKGAEDITQLNDYFLNPNYSIEELEQRLEMEEPGWCLIVVCDPVCQPICESPICSPVNCDTNTPPCPEDAS